MDPKFQSSFIPRRPVVPGGMATVVQKQSISIISIASIIIFLIALGLSAGVFFYEKKLVQANEEKKQQIQTEISSFDPKLIEELTLLKIKIDTADKLLKNHTALTEFFTLLQKNTISTVQFNNFEYTNDTEGVLAITMSGESVGFNDLVFQSDTFLANPYIKDTIFSDFKLDDKGKVSFTVKALLDPTFIAYKKTADTFAVTVSDSTSTSTPLTNTSTSTTATSTASTTTP